MKLPKCKYDKFIFVVTGMSYIIDSSGTSKVVQGHQDIFNENGISFVAIFPISRSSGEGANWKCRTTGCYGLVIDGQLVSALTAIEVLNSLNILKYRGVGTECIGILVHHLIRNDIKEIQWMLAKITKVPVVFYLHDFYTCCVNPNLLKNDSQSCVDRDVSCQGCVYQNKREQHLKIIHDFFRSFESRLTFVAPSDYTLKKWLSFYPEYNRCSVVIPHQKGEGQYIGNRKHIPDSQPLRLAFPGSQKLIKGWDVYRQIIETTRKARCNYEFFYLGNGGEKVEGVHNIEVDVATQGKDAMITALRNEKIDVSLLISNVAETYSYTTYESHAANCFIIALKSGGNIPFLVNEEHWGAVFDSEDDLIQALLSEEEFRKIINSWIDASPLGPDHYVDNDEIVKLFPAGAKSKILWKNRKDKPLKRIKRMALNQLFIMTRLKGKAS